MKKANRHWRLKKVKICFGIVAMFLICTVLSIGTPLAAAQAQKASFAFAIDHVMGRQGKASGTVCGTERDLFVDRGEKLTVDGWLLTADGISGFEYAIDQGAWLPVADSNCKIYARKDLQNGYNGMRGDASRCGFSVELSLASCQAGAHQVFLRGVTCRGEVCEFLAMTDLIYIGEDWDDGFALHLSFASVADEYMQKEAKTGYTDRILTLHDGDSVCLGWYDMSLYSGATLLYQTAKGFSAKDAELLLSYGNQSQSLMTVDGSPMASGERETAISFASLTGRRELVLQYRGSEPIYVIALSMSLRESRYYTEELTIRMDQTAVGYLNGANKTISRAEYDKGVGSCLNMTVSEDTNDPYVYFPIAQYLKKERQIAVSADTYGYVVLRVRSATRNRATDFRLYLCAGTVTSPRGGYSHAFSLQNDGEWHTVILQLSALPCWTGTIHGIRLDYLEGNVICAGDEVSLSEIVFCKTAKEAEKVAQSAPQPDENPNELLFGCKDPANTADHINYFDDSCADCFSSPNACRIQFNEYGDLCFVGAETSNDPFVSFDLATYLQGRGYEAPHCTEVGAIVLRIFGDRKSGRDVFELFYYTDTHPYAEAGCSRTASYQADGAWEYLLFDLRDAPSFTGKLIGFRLDYGTKTYAGGEVYLSDLYMFKTKEEAQAFIASADRGTEDTTETGSEDSSDTKKIPQELQGEKISGEERLTDIAETGTDSLSNNTEKANGCGSVTSGILILFSMFSAVLYFEKRSEKRHL